ncbi:MAG: cytochrome b562 [Chthoniobacterales bacterium]
MNNSCEQPRHPAIMQTIAATTLLLMTLSLGVAESSDDSSPVEALMKRISRSMKKLSRQYDNEASLSSSLELLEQMIKANAEAATLIPESVGDRTGEEREKYLARYREGMAELGQCLSKLKAALEANEIGQAEALMEAAYALRDKFHDELL